MTLGMQILWGSSWLGISCGIHVLCLSIAIGWTSTLAGRIESWRIIWRTLMHLSLALIVIVFSHTAQVWKWAAILLTSDEMSGWNEALYFALITYTTLGYGDVVLSESWRVFGAFAAVTGLLTFGMSTAFIVTLLSRIAQEAHKNAGPRA